MIQRIQSLWLLLAAAAAFAGFRFSFFSGTKLNDVLLHELNASSSFILMIGTVAVGSLALVTIFLYKKRILQLRLCVLGIFLEAVLIFLYYRESTTFIKGTFSLTAILQGVIILAFVWAARGINKDEKLIKTSDRLR